MDYFRHAFLIIYWLIGSIFHLFSPQAYAQEISLSGEHLIQLQGDDPSYAVSHLDDGAWEKVDVPASLRSLGLTPRTDVFWYRIKFNVPKGWQNKTPAVNLGIIDRADETFLNGVKIGGEGQVGPRLSDWHVYPPILPRLYPFDPNILNYGSENILAVRVAREPYIDDGGIIAGPISIVRMEDAFPQHVMKRSQFLGLNYFFFGIETLISVSYTHLTLPTKA